MSMSRFVHAVRAAAVLAVMTLVVGAAPLAQSGAAVIVASPGVSATSLTPAQVRDILLGEQQHWPGSNQRITVVRPDRGTAWEAVLAKALRLSEAAYSRRIATKHYAGDWSALPRVVNSPAELRRVIAQTPGAIGILPVDDADASVKVLKINDLAPGDAGYLLVP